MIEKLNTLEEEARALEPDLEQRIGLTAKSIQFAQEYLNDLPDKKAFVQSDEKGRKLLEHPFTEEPAELADLLSLVRSEVNHAGLNPPSGGHLGYIPGGGIYTSALGDYLAAVTNRYAGVFFSSPGAVRMENMCIRWMCRMVGYPETSAGNLTSGGSIANMIALATARDSAGLRSGEYDRTVIYTTRQVHHSAIKGLRFTGLGDATVRTIAMDRRYRMKPDELQSQIERDRKEGLLPFLIIASAGTTDLGAVDPLQEIADLAEQYRLWLHVDAAYGGFFLLTDRGRELMAGIGRAHSVTIDPHKGLFLPYGLGAVLVKDGQQLYDSQHMAASYMQDTLRATDELSPADLSPELSKHFRGLRMWLPLQLHGIRPFRASLREKLLLTRYFYDEIRKIDGIETGPEPELTVMFFRYLPESGDANAFNERLVREIQEDGRIFLSSTRIDGTFYIRLAVLGVRTHREHIERTLEIVREKIDLVKGH